MTRAKRRRSNACPILAGAAVFDAAWDKEWERNLVDAAMERVKLRA